MNSFTEENYLKTMFLLSEKKGSITVNELSKSLQIKMPTVNSMVKKLAKKGLLRYEPYKPIELNERGKIEALQIIRKHRLTEMFLVEKMGFGWEEVHEVAEQIEHINSPKFFKKMDEILGKPEIDPHGSPIPDSTGKIKIKESKSLDQFTKGEKLKIVGVTDSSEYFLKYLNQKEIQLDTELEILEKEDFDLNLTIKIKNKVLILSSKVTEKLLVEKL